MEKCCGVVIGILLVGTWSGFAAEPPMPACSLLTAAEISDAVGMPAGPSQESDIVIPEGPSKGETMSMWGIRLRRDSWNMTAVTQKCTACPSLAAAALEA